MAFDFHKQIKVGDIGEELIFNYYPEPLLKYAGNKADFKMLKTGELLEVKTDTYPMDDTLNFFMERWSDVHKEKPGGPWQSRKHRVKRYVYLFVKDGVYFQFPDIKHLCKEVDSIVKAKKLRLIYIKNKGWTTAGYLIKREWLEHIYDEYELPK